MGSQDERDMSEPDATFLRSLYQKKKVPKSKAGYDTTYPNDEPATTSDCDSCIKCKFNLGDEGKCHLVSGKINNERGISKFFSPKGDGMLPGDIVWMYVKGSGKKLKYNEGHVIAKGAPGFQCKDCKYYLYSQNCLLVEGKFKPKMSCGYVVKIEQGVRI
jgi:hypothetical protein